MYVQFTNTDSTGSPVTRSLTVEVDGERYHISVSGTGTANVSREVGEYLVNSDTHAVEPHADADTDSHDTDENDDEDDTADVDPAVDDGDDDDNVDDDVDDDSSLIPDSIADRVSGEGND